MNKLRFRSGQVLLRRVPVNVDTVIEVGDLLWLDGDEVKPASDFTWDTDLATSQAAFAAVFLGIAHQPSAAGESIPVSIDVSSQSVYEFDTDNAAYTFGQSLGPGENSSTLSNKQLTSATASSSIARAAEFSTTATNKLRVSFASAFALNSSNVNSSLG